MAGLLKSMGIPGEISHPNAALVSRACAFGLLVGSDSGADQLLPLVAYLALIGPVNVLDAGNHFDVIRVAYAIRHVTPDLYSVSERTKIVRAFTCIEAVKALQQTQAGTPLVIIDLLATFYDDAVSDGRSLILVQECISQITRLKVAAPVIVSVRATAPIESRRKILLPTLIENADVVEQKDAETSLVQGRLF